MVQLETQIPENTNEEEIWRLQDYSKDRVFINS